MDQDNPRGSRSWTLPVRNVPKAGIQPLVPPPICQPRMLHKTKATNDQQEEKRPGDGYRATLPQQEK
jgi:hypothetical protein